MDYKEQRELGSKLFPEIASIINDESNCYNVIFLAIHDSEPLRERFLNLLIIPNQWKYLWVNYFGPSGTNLRISNKSPLICKDPYWYPLWVRLLNPTSEFIDSSDYSEAESFFSK